MISTPRTALSFVHREDAAFLHQQRRGLMAMPARQQSQWRRPHLVDMGGGLSPDHCCLLTTMKAPTLILYTAISGCINSTNNRHSLSADNKSSINADLVRTFCATATPPPTRTASTYALHSAALFAEEIRVAGSSGDNEHVRTLNLKHPLPFCARSISFDCATNAVRTPGSKAYEGECYGDWYREVV